MTLALLEMQGGCFRFNERILNCGPKESKCRREAEPIRRN